jgi:hypothetical protein
MMPYPRKKPARRPGMRPRGTGRDSGASRSPRLRSGRPARTRYARRPARDEEDDHYGRASYGRYGRAKSSSKTPLFLGIGGVAVVVIILVVVFASGGSDYSDPGDACLALFRALRDGDGGTIYNLICRDAKKEFDANAAARGLSSREYCSRAFKAIHILGGSEWTEKLDQVEVVGVKVDGGEAVVTVSAPSMGQGPAHFIWEDGGWKLANP